MDTPAYRIATVLIMLWSVRCGSDTLFLFGAAYFGDMAILPISRS